MGKVIIDLNDEEEALFRAKVGDRTQREAVFDALNIPYRERRIGRPSTSDVEERERRLMQIHIDKIKAYDEAHKDEVSEAKRVLGVDAKKGTVTPAQGLGKHKSEG